MDEDPRNHYEFSIHGMTAHKHVSAPVSGVYSRCSVRACLPTTVIGSTVRPALVTASLSPDLAVHQDTKRVKPGRTLRNSPSIP